MCGRNIETIEDGPTVIYRRRDLEGLISRLRDQGHVVEDLSVAPDTHHLDGYVDTPPYSAPPHLRLELDGYASTSVALVVRRGTAWQADMARHSRKIQDPCE